MKVGEVLVTLQTKPITDIYCTHRTKGGRRCRSLGFFHGPPGDARRLCHSHAEVVYRNPSEGKGNDRREQMSGRGLA